MTTTSTASPQTAQRIAGLRALADFLEHNPDLAEHVGNDRFLVAVSHEPDPKALMAQFARAAKAAGIPVAKSYDETWGNVELHFGSALSICVFAPRDAVCERIVLGTETVTKTVKDPEALKAVPDVVVTEEVELVEWRCLPLLDDREQVPA